MKYLEYSIQAARFMLVFLVLVGGSTALGYWIKGDSGWMAGFFVGLLLVLVWGFWWKWKRRRGEEWIRTGRELGLGSLYSERARAIPLPGFEERGEVLGGVMESVELHVGDP